MVPGRVSTGPPLIVGFAAFPRAFSHTNNQVRRVLIERQPISPALQERFLFSFFFALAIPAQVATSDTATTVVPAAIPRILSRHRFFHHGLRPVLAPLSWKSCSNLYLSRDSQRASLEFGTCRTRGRSGAICVDDRQQANALAVECQHQSERSVLVAQEAQILRQMLGLTGKISSSCLNSRAILGLWNRFFMASPIVDS